MPAGRQSHQEQGLAHSPARSQPRAGLLQDSRGLPPPGCDLSRSAITSLQPRGSSIFRGEIFFDQNPEWHRGQRQLFSLFFCTCTLYIPFVSLLYTLRLVTNKTVVRVFIFRLTYAAIDFAGSAGLAGRPRRPAGVTTGPRNAPCHTNATSRETSTSTLHRRRHPYTPSAQGQISPKTYGRMITLSPLYSARLRPDPP